MGKLNEKEEFWIEIRNWEKFQHYKKQSNPAWIKLYASLHTDAKYLKLQPSERGILMDLWLLAGRNSNVINYNLHELRLLLRTRISPKAIKRLEEHGFILIHSRVTLEQSYEDSRATLPREDKRREEKSDSRARVETIVQLWNEFSGRKAKGLFPKRIDLVCEHLKENAATDYWTEIFKMVARSAFLSDSTKKWVTLQWVMDRHVEISEGKYDNKGEENGNYVLGSSSQLR